MSHVSTLARPDPPATASLDEVGNSSAGPAGATQASSELAALDDPVTSVTDGEEPEWQKRALCAQTDPDAFFPENGGSTRAAKSICSGCEVRAKCLNYALAHDERFGIWGGLSVRERRRLQRAEQ